jgi:hypothetical protein
MRSQFRDCGHCVQHHWSSHLVDVVTIVLIVLLIAVVVISIPVGEAIRDKERLNERRSNARCLTEYRAICDHRPHHLVDYEPES